MVCTACFTACDVADHDADGGPDVRPTSDVIGSPQPTEVPLSGVFVESKANDEYRYDVYEDHVKITKYIGFKTDVTVPEQIDGLPVRIIGYKAFFRNYCFAAQDAAHHTEIGIETLTLPDSVYYIEDYALAGLEEAVTINFGTGLISIGNDALQNCFLLRNLNFSGDNLRYIGAWAFSACRSLENVSLPEGVASIGEAAFICCRSLKHINISDNAETGDGAFFACASMI